MKRLSDSNGEVTVDNRASGDPIAGWGGAVHGSTATLYCLHCGGHWVKRPDRTRPREYCKHCNAYICDACHVQSTLPDYRHRTIDDLTEMVMSGRYTIVGGTVSAPKLIRNT